MRLVWLTLGAVVFLTAMQSDACGNKCDFFERCQGNVLQTCGGVDQVINRSIQERPCQQPNGACVEVGQAAICAHEPVTACDASFNAYCDGSRLVACDVGAGGYLVATECADTGRTCGRSQAGPPACVGEAK